MGLVSCKRRSVDTAQSEGPLPGSPNYTVSASLATLPESKKKEEKTQVGGSATTPAALGAELFLKNCSACHQPSGAGVPGAFPPLDGSPYVTSENTARMAAIMIYGLMGPIKVNGLQYVGAMMPMGAQLTDEELAAIATYIRSSWSNKSSAVSAEVFAQVRKKWGARGPFSIAELGEEN